MTRAELIEEVNIRSRADIVRSRYGETKNTLSPDLIRSLKKFNSNLGDLGDISRPNYSLATKALYKKQHKHSAANNILNSRDDRLGKKLAQTGNLINRIPINRDTIAQNSSPTLADASALLHLPVHSAVQAHPGMRRSEYATLSRNYRTYRTSELEKIRKRRPELPKTIREELIEAITEAAHPKFKMTKPSRRNGDMPTLYQQQLALVLAKRAKKDKTFSGRLKLIRAKIDNSLKGKSGGPHHPIFRWGESLEENQITVGRHDPRKLNKRLNSPTGGDSRFRPLPPRDKKPLQAPKQLGRRRINEIYAEHPFGGKTTIVRTFNMAPDTWRDKAQGYVYTGKKNPTTLERMVGMERGYSAIDAPMFTHADINSQVRSTVNRKVANIRKAWQGKRVIREDIINAIIEAEMSNVGGGGMTSSGKAGGNTRFSGAVSKGGSGGTVISNAGGAVTSSGSGKKLSGGFGTQGSGAGRFSGGGQKFGSRATAAAGVRDVGHGGSFGAPVGSKMSPGGPASRGQTTSAFTGGGSRPTGTASSTGGAQVQAKAPTPAPKAAATSNTGQSQNKTPTPAPKAASTSNSGQTQSSSSSAGGPFKGSYDATGTFMAGSGTPMKSFGAGGKSKNVYSNSQADTLNRLGSEREAKQTAHDDAVAKLKSDPAAREASRNILGSRSQSQPNMQRERAFTAGTGGRFAGGGPRPMGGGGSYGGGGSSYGHSQSGYRNTTNFNIGGSVGFGGGSSRGRIGANFGSSRMNYGSRSSGYYSGR